MKRMKLMSRCYFALLMMVLFAAPAFAYLDPGTLSYVISMIAGLFIAGGAAIAIFRRKIKLFFQNLGKKKQEGEQAAPRQHRVVAPRAEARLRVGAERAQGGGAGGVPGEPALVAPVQLG